MAGSRTFTAAFDIATGPFTAGAAKVGSALDRIATGADRTAARLGRLDATRVTPTVNPRPMEGALRGLLARREQLEKAISTDVTVDVVAATRDLRRLNRLIADTERELEALDAPVAGAGAAWGELWATVGQAPQALAVGGLALGELGRQSVLAATAVESATATLGRSYGTAGEQVAGWARETAGAMGLSQAAATQAGLALTTAVQAAGIAAADTAGIVQALGTRAADLAAAQGVAVEQVTDAIGGALRGETDSIQELGVAISPVAVQAKALALGLVKQGEAASDAATAQATYALIMEQTDRYQGAVADSAGTLSGALRGAQATATDMGASFGQLLGTGLTPVLQVVGALGKGFLALPGPVRQTATAITLSAVAFRLLNREGRLVAALNGTLGAAFTGIGRGLTAVRTGAVTTSTALTRLKTAGRGMAASFGPWGLAIVGISAAVGLLAGRADTAAGAVQGLADAARALGSGDTAAAQAAVVQTLVDNYGDLLTRAEEYGVTSAEVVDAILAEGTAREDLIRSLDEQIAAERRAAVAAGGEITNRGAALEKLKAQLEDAGAATDAERGKLELVSRALGTATTGTDKWGHALSAVVTELDTLMTKIDAVNNKQISLDTARLGTLKALADLQAVVDDPAKRGAGLKANTVAALENRKAVNDVATAMSEELKARLASGETAEEVGRTWETNRDQLRAVVEQLGLGKQEAEDYVNRLLDTPEELVTNLAINGVPTLDHIVREIKGLDGKVVRTTVQITTTGAINYGIPGRGGRAGKDADGGPALAGQPYWVGERGPEIVIPSADGYVVPSERIRAMLGAMTPSGPAGGDVYVTVLLDGQELRHTARVEVDRATAGLARLVRQGRSSA